MAPFLPNIPKTARTSENRWQQSPRNSPARNILKDIHDNDYSRIPSYPIDKVIVSWTATIIIFNIVYLYLFITGR